MDTCLCHEALREQLDLKSILGYGKTLEKSDVIAQKLENAETRLTNEITNHIRTKPPFNRYGNTHDIQCQGNQNKVHRNHKLNP